MGTVEETMAIVEQYDHDGFAEYLVENGLVDHFVNTLKMEPHYGGWMHSRTHGDLEFPDSGGATAHDVNHLTILNDSQTEVFMNDTFQYPQWPALDVAEDVVINYFQSMVTLTDPLGEGIASGTGGDPLTTVRIPRTVRTLLTMVTRLRTDLCRKIPEMAFRTS